MLVIYDKTTGMIVHAIVHAEPGLKHMRKIYRAQGKGTLMHPGGAMADALTSYVHGHRVVPRPVVDVVEPEALADEGVIVFQVNQACQLEVSFADEVVATEALEPGPLSFAVEHHGRYRLRFSAPFPFLDAILHLEVK